jgi:MFS family permease
MRYLLTIGACCLGMLAVGANGTAIMTALPMLARELGLGPTALEWAVNVYLVASAVCIIPGGQSADRIGASRVSLGGLVLFGIASVVIALATTPAVLLAGRGFQGIAAALAVPGTLTLIGQTAGPDRRAGAIGAWTGFLMLGFSLGPLLGGALTHELGWRAVFWCNVVLMIAAAGMMLSGRATPQSNAAARVEGFDASGFALLAVGLTSLILGVQALPGLLQEPLACVVPLIVAAASLAILRKLERSTMTPLLAPAVLGAPMFWRGAAIGALAMGSILALLLYFNLEAQNPAGLGVTPIGAGLLLLPMSASLLGFALAAPQLGARVGLRVSLVAAALATAIAALVIGAATSRDARLPLLLGLFLVGAGLAPPYAAAPRLALAALPSTLTGQGSGVVSACTFLGGALGVALGHIALGVGGFGAVMALVGLAALVGAWLCRRIA